MKKILIIGFILTLAFSSEIYAEELSFSIGVKSWYNDWEITGEGSEKSDSRIFIGPNVKLSYGKFFGGISFMMNPSDYEFPSNTETTRKDIDVVLGYMIHPRIGLVGGYKYLTGIRRNETIMNDDGTIGFHDSYTANGVAFGAAFNYPISSIRLTPYINGILMPLKGEYAHENYDIIGYSAEGGIVYGLFEKLSVSLGYKFQYLDWRHLAKDEMQGITFGLSYNF
jgi:hypothetical protein